MADLAVIVEHDGQTVGVHETCGSEACLKESMIKLGVPTIVAVQVSGGSVKSYTFPDDGNGDVVVTVGDPGESDADTWCAWCGDFLTHGLNCAHPDKWSELAPKASGDLNPHPRKLNHGQYPGRYTRP